MILKKEVGQTQRKTSREQKLGWDNLLKEGNCDLERRYGTRCQKNLENEKKDIRQ